MFKPGDPKPEGSGRKKDSLNKRNLAALEIAAQYDQDPINFLFLVMTGKMKDEGADFEHQLQAAKELAPYLYPKLKQIENTGTGSVEALAELLKGLSGAK